MIPESNEWVFFEDIDFNDPDINQFNVDTRDFHVGYTTDSYLDRVNYAKLEKRPDFFHTGDEVKETLRRLFNESGGAVEWRYLSLTGDAEQCSSGWELKYFRIVRSPKGWLMCNNEYYALNKSKLECSVNQKSLCAH